MAGGDAWDYTYDLQGNLIRETGPKGERQYLYDSENRQIRVLSGGKKIQEERYDGEGMRAGLNVNGKGVHSCMETGICMRSLMKQERMSAVISGDMV